MSSRACREIADRLVVDTGRLGAEGRLILYVVPAEGCELDDDLAGGSAPPCGPSCPPGTCRTIRQVPGIPRTLSGKKLEVPVRKILLGTEPERAADPDALANPEVLAYFRGDRGVAPPDQHSAQQPPPPGPHGYLKRRISYKEVAEWPSAGGARGPAHTTKEWTMPDNNADEAREALLIKAAQAWTDDSALDPAALDPAALDAAALDPAALDRAALDSAVPGGDAVLRYLRAYYHRVATEDLASPSRLAVVAEAHARLGLRRPQGRALVQVREAGRAHLDQGAAPNLVVDIVTDDMPYLVDSVTTRLNRHQAEIRLLVHPLLRVRRDVAGALRQIAGLGGDEVAPGPPDEVTESWIHVELEPPGDRVTGQQLETDLRLVLDDVRVAAEDQARMEVAARALADDLGGPGGQRGGRGRRPAALAGRRQLHLPRLPRVRPGADGRRRRRPARPAGHRPGHTPPHPARPGSPAVRLLPAQVAAQAQDPTERLVLAKANSSSPSTAPTTWTMSRSSGSTPDGRVAGELRFLGLFACGGLHRQHRYRPGDAAQGAQVLDRRRAARRAATAARIWPQILEVYPREELFQIAADELIPIALGVLRLPSAGRPGCSCAGTLRPVHVLPGVPAPGPLHHAGPAAHQEVLLGRRLTGPPRLTTARPVGDSALARLHFVVRAERGRTLPQVDAAALEQQAGRRDPVLG